jgi:hypothetical protein
MMPNLTDEQREKLKQIEERHRRRHRGRWQHEFTPEPSLTP